MAGQRELETIAVRDKVKGVECNINASDFDEERYERVTADPRRNREQELALMKTPALRDLAEGYGLDVEGKKSELVARILAYENENEE